MYQKRQLLAMAFTGLQNPAFSVENTLESRSYNGNCNTASVRLQGVRPLLFFHFFSVQPIFDDLMIYYIYIYICISSKNPVAAQNCDLTPEWTNEAMIRHVGNLGVDDTF